MQITTGDIQALICFTTITLAFYIIRRLALLAAISMVSISLYMVFAAEKEPGTFLSATGLLFFSFGLCIARIILKRSVSLRMLEACKNGQIVSVADAIRSRIQEAGQLKLFQQQKEFILLTPAGHLFAALVASLRRWLRIP